MSASERRLIIAVLAARLGASRRCVAEWESA
jgi:hypothetical protein